MDSKMKTEKKELLEKVFNEFKKDEKVIIENLRFVMENIMLVGETEHYKASIVVKLEEKNIEKMHE